MKYLLIISLLFSLSTVASPDCECIQVTDSCRVTGGFFAKEVQIEVLCELANQDIKRIVKFDSLRSEMDCAKFEKTVTNNSMSIEQLDNLIESSSPFSKHKIKTIGSDIKSSEERTQAQMNWMRSVKQSMNKKPSQRTKENTRAQIKRLESMRKSLKKSASEKTNANTKALVRKLEKMSKEKTSQE